MVLPRQSQYFQVPKSQKPQALSAYPSCQKLTLTHFKLLKLTKQPIAVEALVVSGMSPSGESHLQILCSAQ